MHLPVPQLSFEDRCKDGGSRANRLRIGRLLQYVKPFLGGLPIILLSGFVLVEGAKFFAFAELNGREGTSIRAEDNRINALISWAKVIGVRSEALAEIISLKAAPVARMPFGRVKPDLATLLTIRPMWGHYWMLFAEARMMGGEAFSQALSAFEMAELTAPREAQVMLERIKFGLLFWELFPPRLRHRCASNLVAIRPILDGHAIATIKTILDVKNEGARADIRSRVEQQAGSDVSWFGQFGL
jgi:hypothetical protein